MEQHLNAPYRIPRKKWQCYPYDQHDTIRFPIPWPFIISFKPYAIRTKLGLTWFAISIGLIVLAGYPVISNKVLFAFMPIILWLHIGCTHASHELIYSNGIVYREKASIEAVVAYTLMYFIFLFVSIFLTFIYMANTATYRAFICYVWGGLIVNFIILLLEKCEINRSSTNISIIPIYEARPTIVMIDRPRIYQQVAHIAVNIDNTNNDVCCVCIEPLVNTEVIKPFGCMHIFHPKCINPWLIYNNTCPLCRTLKIDSCA